ncbi:hypothetical protein GCM10009193_07660 [Shewanella aestuarii]|nr:hypothetical protein GCM10009193_07660 [Shewanella aestuarii]
MWWVIRSEIAKNTAKYFDYKHVAYVEGYYLDDVVFMHSPQISTLLILTN